MRQQSQAELSSNSSSALFLLLDRSVFVKTFGCTLHKLRKPLTLLTEPKNMGL